MVKGNADSWCSPLPQYNTRGQELGVPLMEIEAQLGTMEQVTRSTILGGGNVMIRQIVCDHPSGLGLREQATS